MLKKLITSHTTAKPNHYDIDAHIYDEFMGEPNLSIINSCIEKILKKHKVKSVLDVTCGTGIQVFWLAQRGFDVIGSDINAKMLSVAKKKAKHQKLKVQFMRADMRNVQAGKFDSVISIFNAVGHVTKSDFLKTMRNVHKNLKPKGLFIFDIFNLTYLLRDDNITKMSFDKQILQGKIKTRAIQFSTIDDSGLFPSYTFFTEHRPGAKLKLKQAAQSLQVYTVKQLTEMLHKTGFKVIHKCEVDGSAFSETKSERMVIVARKI